MWYLTGITLICGQSQVKCINHTHTHTDVYSDAASTRTNTHTIKRSGVFANLRGSGMNVLAHRVFDTI